MCGIAGWLKLSYNYTAEQDFIEYFGTVLNEIAERGPDSFGAVGYNDGATEIVKHTIDDRKWILTDSMYSENTVVMCNFRGIPTTETGDKFSNGVMDPQHIQPFEFCNKFITHNGLFHNDVEITDKFQLGNITRTKGHDIDTYIILKLMDKFESVSVINDWYKTMSLVEGSYALAYLDADRGYLCFARSYRGLVFTVFTSDSGNKYLVWASEGRALEGDLTKKCSVQWELPLDTALCLHISSIIRSNSEILREFKHSLIPLGKRAGDNSVAVVISGGMDSTVAATLCAKRFSNVHLLHFKYGAKAEEQEIKAVTEITKYLQHYCKVNGLNTKICLDTLDLSFLKNLGGSTLIDEDASIAEGEKGVEFAYEWVPARNLVMMSMAAAYCDRHDIGNICLGLNMEEASVYSDNSFEFFSVFEKAVAIGSKSRPRMYMPLANMMKHHIVAVGLEEGAPLHLTWSCYHGGSTPCGNCGPCLMRLKSFLMNGAQECQQYKSYPDWFPTSLRIASV